jgi:2-polyprenyl-3-methyl-5-hydroxy-6-metoxy-1,4-benzoquinol methylase
MTIWSVYSNFYDTLNNLKAYTELINIFPIIGKKYVKDREVKILDLGCGTGNVIIALSKTFKKSEFVGIDLNSDMLEIANKKLKQNKLKYHLINLNIEKIDKRHKYDLITMNNVLYCIDNKKDMMLSLKSKLKKNGYLIISDPKPVEDYKYTDILNHEFTSLERTMKLIFIIPSLIVVLILNKFIDKKYTRLNLKEYTNLFKSVDLKIVENFDSYANQANFFVLSNDD